MGLIEDALRSTFEAQVRNPPAVEDAAGRAIRQAVRVRRRHAASAALAAAACIALVSTGTALLAPSGDAVLPPIGHSSAVNPVVPNLPITVLNGRQLVLPSRQVIELKLDGAERAWRTADGWLVRTRDATTDTRTLWFLAPGGGTPQALASGRAVIVSPDGGLVAWGGDDRLSVATRSGAAVSIQAETTGTGRLEPVLFAGGGVLLREPDRNRHQLWLPAGGSYHPTVSYDGAILALTSDGSRLYALSGTDYPCLVSLVPEKLSRADTECDLALSGATGAYPSPDGRWLAITFAGRVELYDAARLWSAMPPTQVWYTNAYGLTWLDGESLVVSTGQYLKRYTVDRPGQGETFVASTDGATPATDAPWVWPVATLG